MPYLANRWHTAQLTNIHYWDSVGAAWSGNLVGAAVPFAFLPNPVVAGDLVLFGIDSTVLNSGPFGSLVFDIGSVITDVTNINWLYSDASGVLPTGWAAFGAATIQDNTDQDGIGGGVAFDTSGISSVSWRQNALWVVQNPTIGGAALGVTGLWICAHVTIAGGAGVPPQQSNRNIYTVNWPAVDLPEPGGDLEALPRMRFREQADEIIIHTIAGLRKTDRGEDFRSYINLGNTQNAPGITTAAVNGGAFQADPRFPTGTIIRSTNPPAGGSIDATVNIDNTYASQYRGVYHAYLRALQPAGAAGVISVQFTQFIGDALHSTQTFASNIVPTNFVNQVQLFDLGQLSIPGGQGSPLDFALEWHITAYGDGAEDVDLIDIVIIPVDEWACDVTGNQPDERNNATYKGIYIDIDSISYPKQSPFVGNYGAVTQYQIHDPHIAGGSGGFIPNETQRLHVVTAILQSGGLRSWPWHLESFDAWWVQRYSSMRGAR